VTDQDVHSRTGGFEVWASRAAAALPNALRRIPFTLTVVVLTLVVGLIARTIWNPIWQQDWFPQVAFGVPALREGKLWTFVSSWFFAITPGQYITGTVLFLLLVGACEIRLGTRRTAVACVLGQFGGILLASLIVLGLSYTPWVWAQELAGARDVGFTTGMLTVVAVT